MSLGLSHSLSRYKLKFSPDKVRIYQAAELQANLRYASCVNSPKTSRQSLQISLKGRYWFLHRAPCCWLLLTLVIIFSLGGAFNCRLTQ